MVGCLVAYESWEQQACSRVTCMSLTPATIWALQVWGRTAWARAKRKDRAKAMVGDCDAWYDILASDGFELVVR